MSNAETPPRNFVANAVFMERMKRNLIGHKKLTLESIKGVKDLVKIGFAVQKHSDFCKKLLVQLHVDAPLEQFCPGAIITAIEQFEASSRGSIAPPKAFKPLNQCHYCGCEDRNSNQHSICVRDLSGSDPRMQSWSLGFAQAKAGAVPEDHHRKNPYWVKGYEAYQRFHGNRTDE